jgi:hypothetical protein
MRPAAWAARPSLEFVSSPHHHQQQHQHQQQPAHQQLAPAGYSLQPLPSLTRHPLPQQQVQQQHGAVMPQPALPPQPIALRTLRRNSTGMSMNSRMSRPNLDASGLPPQGQMAAESTAGGSRLKDSLDLATPMSRQAQLQYGSLPPLAPPAYGSTAFESPFSIAANADLGTPTTAQHPTLNPNFTQSGASTAASGFGYTPKALANSGGAAAPGVAAGMPGTLQRAGPSTVLYGNPVFNTPSTPPAFNIAGTLAGSGATGSTQQYNSQFTNLQYGTTPPGTYIPQSPSRSALKPLRAVSVPVIGLDGISAGSGEHPTIGGVPGESMAGLQAQPSLLAPHIVAAGPYCLNPRAGAITGVTDWCCVV